jgi:palmitoyltransferase ZDHHC3/7/25
LSFLLNFAFCKDSKITMGKSCGTNQGARRWLNFEPCGLICGMMTWVLLIFGMYATSKYVIHPWLGNTFMGIFNYILFNGGSIFSMYCHMATMFTDPGSVPRESVPLADDVAEQDFTAVTMEKGGRSVGNRIRSESTSINIPTMIRKYRKFCKRCKAFKPTRAHHCSICGRCIVKMDHHCPWVNNCVGIGNQKLFLLFLLSVNIICFYSLILIIGKFMYCGNSPNVSELQKKALLGVEDITAHANSYRNVAGGNDNNHSHSSGSGGGGGGDFMSAIESAKDQRDRCNQVDANIMVIFLVIESLLFGLFTLCMMGDQTSVLSEGQTQIDKLKGLKHETGVDDFNEVFGCDSDVKFQLEWLVPIPMKFPDVNIKDNVLGYRIVSAEEAERIEMRKKERLGGGGGGANGHSDHSSSPHRTEEYSTYEYDASGNNNGWDDRDSRRRNSKSQGREREREGRA